MKERKIKVLLVALTADKIKEKFSNMYNTSVAITDVKTTKKTKIKIGRARKIKTFAFIKTHKSTKLHR